MEYTYGISDDYLDEDDDGVMYSTKTYSSDSDDEAQFVLSSRKSTKQGRKSNSLEEDEFEKEMAAELQATMKKLTSSMGSSDKSDMTSGESSYYDKIYFDSDESNSEEEEAAPNPNKRKAKHKVLNNDELFYDPLMDDADQAFVDRQRKSYQLKNKKQKTQKGGNKPDPLPQSDAVLNCPACFTTLCLDCQRHEIYKNQYRAMFVFNCAVDKSEVLHFSVKEDKKQKFKKGKKKQKEVTVGDEGTSKAEGNDGTNAAEDPKPQLEGAAGDAFNPVKCTICNTKVAVQDKDEVYHFFNVLTSY